MYFLIDYAPTRLRNVKDKLTGERKTVEAVTANPQANSANPHLPNAVPTQQKSGGMAQQQPQLPNPQANPTQLPQQTDKPLSPQQMRFKRQKTALLRKNSGL